MAIKKKSQPSRPSPFAALLSDVKGRIQSAQTRAVLAVNAELVRLYWDIGQIIHQRQEREGWGAAIIPKLAAALHNELPEEKGFSERNIKQMLAFYREYADVPAIVPQVVAQLEASAKVQPPVALLQTNAISPPPVAKLNPSPIVQPLVALLPSTPVAPSKSSPLTIVPQPAAQLPDSIIWLLPWAHHVILMQKIKHLPTRLWYMQQSLAHGWSRNILALQIDAHAHTRHGKAVTNFAQHLPAPQSDLARQTLKDPYIFDFLTLTDTFHERDLQTQLVAHVQKFLLELGQGFAFVGRQYRFTVGKEDFYIDLLFYHLRLRAFVAIDLKKGNFKPEYSGKINFYCNVINDRLKHATDQPTIGLILCQSKDHLLAEYSLSSIDQPIGIATYELTRSLPKNLRSVLPTVQEIEAELSAITKTPTPQSRRAKPHKKPLKSKRRARTV